MKQILWMTAVGVLAFPELALANCIGTGAFRTCTDSSGNNYTINDFGSTTTMQGYNSRTGSTWSQNSTTMGNTTIHNGYSSDGGNWNMTQQRLGGTTITNGFDSDGNYFSQTCTAYGCN